MDSHSNNNSLPSKSTAKVIKNIQNMSWLKKETSEKNCKSDQLVSRDKQVMSAKKTDEDYFPGTREEKKMKKKKDKKVKAVFTLDQLNRELKITQQQEQNNETTPIPDYEQLSESNRKNKTKQIDLACGTKAARNTTNPTVWSTATNSADKLFPNVQSVRIDRLEEEEMLSRALAESISTIQLEQFRKPSPEKENQWEALYGDSDDEGGWGNIKKNLPPTFETTSPAGDSSSQRKSCRANDTNSSKPGILKDKPKDPDSFSTDNTELNFHFKPSSDSSKNDVKKDHSSKSVSFNEAIDVKISSDESSDNDEFGKNLHDDEKGGPKIDKFGRVDGYSERRLFMGKGARMKEQEYIQNKCNSVNKDTELKSTLLPIVIKKMQEPTATALKTVESQKTLIDRKEAKTEKAYDVKNVNNSPHTSNQKIESNSQATTVTEKEGSRVDTLQHSTNSQSQKSTLNVKEPNTKDSIGTKNYHRELKSPKDIINSDEKMNKSVSKSTADIPSSKLFSPNRDSTINSSAKSVVRQVSSVKLKPEIVGKKELERTEKTREQIRKTNNIIRPHNKTSKTPSGVLRKEEQINDLKNDSKGLSNLDEMNLLPRNMAIIEKKGVEGLNRNFEKQDINPQDFATLLSMDNNLTEQESSDEQSESVGRCLVPTLIRDDNYIQDAGYGTQAYHPGFAAQNLSSPYLDSQDLQYQNYAVHNSLPSNNVPNINMYVHESNEPQMNQTEYAPPFIHDVNTNNYPLQTISLNSGYWKVLNFSNGENILTSTRREDSITSCNEVSPYEMTDNYRDRSLTTQGPPGVIQRLQLPSGFPTKVSSSMYNANENNPTIRSVPVKQNKKVVEPEKKNSYNKNKTNSRYFVRQRKSPTQSGAQTNCSFAKIQKTHNVLQNGSKYHEPRTTEFRKIPYPILGAAQNSHKENNETKINRDTTTDRSQISTIEMNSNNNYYYPISSTPNESFDLDNREINDSPQNLNITPQSAVPMMCQIPGDFYPGSSNWQNNVHSMTPRQGPMDFMHNYQMNVQKPPGIPVFSNYSQPPMYGNQSIHQWPMHMLSPAQIPGYPIPHAWHMEKNTVQDLQNFDCNQTENNNIGRGRGRLPKRNLF